MGMKVCKLVRLTQKDNEGFFTAEGEGKITVRAMIVVSEESIKETKENYQISGLLYVVDKAATAARDKVVDAEVEEARNPAGDAPKAPAVPIL